MDGSGTGGGRGGSASWRLEGMDCAACVAKVTKAVERLPGVSDIAVNLMAERLTATLADPAGAAAVEGQVAALGYKATRLDLPAAPASPGGAGLAAAAARRAHGGADGTGQGQTAHDHDHDHEHGEHHGAEHDHPGRDEATHERGRAR